MTQNLIVFGGLSIILLGKKYLEINIINAVKLRFANW